MKWLAKRLLPRMIALSTRREPDFMVTRDKGTRIYLKRWWLIPRNNFFNIYLHNMLLDDDAVLHDHPYISLSLVLTDGLVEHYVKKPRQEWAKECLRRDGKANIEWNARQRDTHAGDLVYRSSQFAHQLVVMKPAWTIFMTGPRIKTWGFWCPRGFRKWDKYVEVTQDPSGKNQGGKSNVGIGCGEQS
jgi:hypothetical protein